MSDLITGTHFQRDDLNGQNIIHELECFGQWAYTVEFHTLAETEEFKKCEHKGRELKLKPVISELGYKIEVDNIHD